MCLQGLRFFDCKLNASSVDIYIGINVLIFSSGEMDGAEDGGKDAGICDFAIEFHINANGRSLIRFIGTRTRRRWSNDLHRGSSGLRAPEEK